MNKISKQLIKIANEINKISNKSKIKIGEIFTYYYIEVERQDLFPGDTQTYLEWWEKSSAESLKETFDKVVDAWDYYEQEDWYDFYGKTNGIDEDKMKECFYDFLESNNLNGGELFIFDESKKPKPICKKTVGGNRCYTLETQNYTIDTPADGPGADYSVRLQTPYINVYQTDNGYQFQLI